MSVPRPARSTLASAAALVVALAGCAREPVPMPSDRAPAVEVVHTYLKALQAEDCETAHALRLSDDGGWCGDITVSDYRVSAAVCAGEGGVGEQYAQSTYVPVHFITHGGDDSLPDGWHDWGYVLVRNDNSEPWRIADEGVG